MKKTIKFLCTACVALLLWGVGAVGVAADTLTPYFSASPTALNTSTADLSALPADAITWYPADGVYYLFLPANTDRGAIRVWFNAAKITVDGKTVQNNTVTNAFAQTGDHTVIAGNASYVLRVMQSANIPVLFLSTSSGTMANIDNSPDHSVGETGAMLLMNDDGSVVYNGSLAQVRGRGNSTWNLQKKPYQIKLDAKTDLFGMGKAKTWILLANYADKSLVRTASVLDTAASAGLQDTVKYTYVDLYADHEYLGNYQLTEKVEVDTNRVNITDLEKATEKVNGAGLETYSRGGDVDSTAAGSYKYYNIPNNPGDISGGYLLEFDYASRYLDEACGFVTNHGVPVVIKSPEYASRAQVEYIRGYVQAAEDALYSATGYNTAGKYYTDYIDLDSAALHYLIEEWCKNVDAGSSSFYLYKDTDSAGGGKLRFDQVWDYDLTFGNSFINFRALSNPSVWYVKNIGWFNLFFSHQDFVDRVQTLYDSGFRDAMVAASDKLSAYEEELNASAAMNFRRWDMLDMRENDTGDRFSGCVAYVKNFMAARLTLLDTGFTASDQNVPFSDVYINQWYYNDVRFVYQRGIMVGTSDQTFDPGTSLTRAMVVQVLANFDGANLTKYGASPFGDVQSGDWYAPAVAWAAKNNIVMGIGDNNFGPGESVTREQMITMLYRYCQYKEVEIAGGSDLAVFTDAAAVSGYAVEAMGWAVANEFIQGVSESELQPQGLADRAQAAAIFARFYRHQLMN